MIRPRIRETIEALGRAARSAGLGFEGLDRVLLVGGSVADPARRRDGPRGDRRAGRGRRPPEAHDGARRRVHRRAGTPAARPEPASGRPAWPRPDWPQPVAGATERGRRRRWPRAAATTPPPAAAIEPRAGACVRADASRSRCRRRHPRTFRPRTTGGGSRRGPSRYPCRWRRSSAGSRWSSCSRSGPSGLLGGVGRVRLTVAARRRPRSRSSAWPRRRRRRRRRPPIRRARPPSPTADAHPDAATDPDPDAGKGARPGSPGSRSAASAYVGRLPGLRLHARQLPGGRHVHFFFNTVPPTEAGIPAKRPWNLYAAPIPFRQYKVADRPAEGDPDVHPRRQPRPLGGPGHRQLRGPAPDLGR